MGGGSPRGRGKEEEGHYLKVHSALLPVRKRRRRREEDN